MSASILTSVKAALGLADDYVAFDSDIIMHINSTLGTLTQLGIGPDAGFAITDNSSTWEQFMGTDPRFNTAQSYVYLCVRLLFDISSLTGPLLEAMKQQKQEMEWRLNVVREEIVHPLPPEDVSNSITYDEIIFDGGTI